MQFHRCLSVVAASTLLLPSTAHAQQAQSIPGDVTFELPVNLTRISGAISKVMVTCNISSAALAGSPNKKLAAQVELPVVAGPDLRLCFLPCNYWQAISKLPIIFC